MDGHAAAWSGAADLMDRLGDARSVGQQAPCLLSAFDADGWGRRFKRRRVGGMRAEGGALAKFAYPRRPFEGNQERTSLCLRLLLVGMLRVIDPRFSLDTGKDVLCRRRDCVS